MLESEKSLSGKARGARKVDLPRELCLDIRLVCADAGVDVPS
jgi:hypothetical protein